MAIRDDQAAVVSKVARVYNFMAQFGEGSGGSENLHVGFFEHENDDLATAQDRLIREISSRLNVAADSHLIDVGCGLGLPMVEISNQFGCQITGVTIAEVQAFQAKQLVMQSGLSGRVRPVIADAHRLPFAPRTFDSAVAIESLLHMNRAEALAEIGRVMRPGGTFALCDFYELQPLTDDEATALQRQFCINAIPLPLYRELLQTCGFTDLKDDDWTSAVMPTYTHWARFTPEAGVVTPAPFVSRYQSIAAAILPIIGAKLGYLCISARKA